MTLRKSILDSLWIAEKDLKGLLQLRVRLFLTVMLPIFGMFLFSFRFGGVILSEAPVAVAMDESDRKSLELARMLDETSEIAVVSTESSDATQQLLGEGKVYGAIIIPKGFSSRLEAGLDCEVQLLLDDSNPILASSIRSVVERVIEQFNGEMNPQLVKPKSEFLYGTDLNYVPFLASGLVAMTAMFGAILQALSIVWERSLRTLDLLLVAPVRAESVVVGKVLAGTVAGVAQAIMILLAAKVLFAVELVNLPLVILIVFLSSFTFTGMGVLMSCVAKDPKEAAGYNHLLSWPMVFVGGVFFPLEALPSWLQPVSRVLPLTYSVEALRAVMIKGHGIYDVALDLLVLACFAVLLLYLGSRLLIQSETR